MAPCMPVVFKMIDRIMTSDVLKRSVEASRAVDPDLAVQGNLISKQGTCSAALKMQRAGH